MQASGDEPKVVLIKLHELERYPARAGMDPDQELAAMRASWLPRARGDEPIRRIG